MRNFSGRNNLLWIESINGSVDYTYHNDVNARYSLIDHILCSNLVTVSKSAHILVAGDNPSDRWAIYCDFCCPKLASRVSRPQLPKHHAETTMRQSKYRQLQSITLWFVISDMSTIDALACNGSKCCNHTADLDAYYNDVKTFMHSAGLNLNTVPHAGVLIN